MATEDKKYWLGLADKEGLNEGSSKEFDLDHPVMSGLDNALTKEKSTRRDFLKVLGFSVSAAAIAASCEMPVRKSIPYTIKPEEIIPGIPNYYATAYTKGGEYNSLLVKTREGRPILFEGNKISSITRGGVNSKAMGSLLSLYDDNRIKNPLKGKEKSSWAAVNKEISEKLATTTGKIAFLSSTILSPSVKRAIAKFSEKYATTEHVEFDAISYAGLLDANFENFGKRAIPNYKFDEADLVVAIGADFLGSWINPTEYTSSYGVKRKVDNLGRHIQIESVPTLSGSNADLRIPVKASEEELAVIRLYNLLAQKANATTYSDSSFVNEKLVTVANELWAAKGHSIVISGSNNKGTQLIVNAINTMLGNYGQTIDMASASFAKQGDDTKLNTLLADMNAGKVGAVIVLDTNPAYFLADKFTSALSKVALKIDLSERNTETTAFVDYVCPSDHFLETWSDAIPREGVYATIQPAIAPLYDTKNTIEIIMSFAGETVEAYDFTKETCKTEVFAKQNKYGSLELLWTNTVHDGEANFTPLVTENISTFIDLSSAAATILRASNLAGDIEIKFYENSKLGDGSLTDNPWVLELADPITRISWDHYILANPTWVKENGLLHNHKNKKYNEITVSVNGKDITLPVVALPGMPMGVLGVSYGMGRTNVAHPDLGRGASLYPMVKGGASVYSASWSNAGTTKQVAIMQQEHRLEHKGLGGVKTRKIVKETTLEEYKVNAAAGNVINEGMGWVDRNEWVEKHMTSLYGPEGKEIPHSQEYGGAHVEKLSQGHHWGMAIDLNSCTGCGACVVACNVENNVPVVGQNEVRRAHDMNWLRIDKYHTGEEDNPQVVFQPMMCQHCDNAPCENVCPVNATNHSSEGLNQMVYNRCIGTRYCANNCPYKVRRFNWFDYQGADSFSKDDEMILPIVNNDFDGDLSYESDEHKLGLHDSMARMVLNPDVTVRGRGVIEKCSFCVQRVQLGKLEAKKGNHPLADGAITTACQSVCPTNAIEFGDTNNDDSKVRKAWDDERAFGVIEEIHTLPSVRYLVKVRNQKTGDYNA
tara:strand:- start:25 stop:3174 length:3150 start_codon:yes stop_codon:yes gene_type:complete